MNPLLDEIAREYADALEQQLAGGGEAALLRAYEAGRRAVAAGLGVLEMSAVHQIALTSVLLARLPEDERRRVAALAADFSAESLVPFEITARGERETSAMLKELNEALESKNAEIRARLEELRQLQSLKDDLISLIVHDLRNPLAGVRSCIDLLEPRGSEKEAEATREVVRLARDGIRKLSELVNDMLEVRRLEEGKLELKRERASPPAILRQAMTTLEASAKLHDVRLVVSDATDAPIDVDVRLVRRSLENLISNALGFSRAGDAIELAVRAAPGGVSLEVGDRGPGVPDEVRERLFQKFATSGARSAGPRRGHGLGLYFVKLVATAHGGSASVAARDGGGSLFRIFLPVRGNAPP